MANELDPKQVRAWSEEVKASKKELSEIRDLSSVLNNYAKDLTKHQITQNKNMSTYLDASIKAAKSGKITLNQLKSRADIMKEIADGSMDLNQVADKQKNIEKEIVQIQRRYIGANKKKGDSKVKELEKDLKMLETEKERLKTEQRSEAVVGALDDLTGGMASQIKEFSDTWTTLGPKQAIMLASFTAMVAILKSFSDQLDAIGESFGAIGVQQFSQDLMSADAEMAKLGFDTGTAATMAEQLSSNYGIAFDEAIQLAPAIGDMSKALGISVEEGGAFVGQMTQITGLSSEAAINLAKMTTQLAVANGIAPGAVMRDIAASSAEVAQWTDESGENIAKAAIQAKKLGLNLSDSAAAADSLLDFQSSMEKQFTASALLGRQINLQEARRLAFAKDLGGMQREIVKQLGDANEWTKLDVFQQRALADAVGMSVDNIAKMLSGTKEQLTLSGELAKQEGFESLVGEEALSNLAEMINSLKSTAAVLTKILGPPLNFIAGIFAETAKVIGTITGGLAGMVGPMGMVGIAAMMMGKKMLWSAVAGIWKGLSWMWSIPVVGPVLAIAAGIGATRQIYKSLTQANAQSAGDFVQRAGDPTPTVSTGVGAFKLNKKDDLVAGPGIADTLTTDVSKTTGGQSTMIDVSPVVTAIGNLKNEIVSLKTENITLREDMKNYFGTGGLVAKQIGKRTIGAIENT